jgi:hypothetical protein
VAAAAPSATAMPRHGRNSPRAHAGVCYVLGREAKGMGRKRSVQVGNTACTSGLYEASVGKPTVIFQEM